MPLILFHYRCGDGGARQMQMKNIPAMQIQRRCWVRDGRCEYRRGCSLPVQGRDGRCWSLRCVSGCSLSGKQKAKTLTRLQSHTIPTQKSEAGEFFKTQNWRASNQAQRIGVCYHYIL